VRSPHGPDKEYVYIEPYSYVECGGGYQWLNSQWTMVTECYQYQTAGYYAYIGSGNQPQINSYCKGEPTEPYCNWRDDPPSGGGGPGPSEWQNLTIPNSSLLNDQLTSPPQPPTCPPPHDVNYSQNLAWCNAPPPASNSKAEQRILNALDKMYALGGECQERAMVMTQVYIQGNLHVYSEGAAGAGVGGFAPVGEGNDGYVGIADTWTKYAYDENHKTKPKPGSDEPALNLQNILAHEADHLLGWSHQGDPAWSSPHTLLCGG
jgi:hypothetical protein